MLFTREEIQRIVESIPGEFVCVLFVGLLYAVLWSAAKTRDRFKITPVVVAIGLVLLSLFGLCLCAFLTMAFWD